MPKDDQARREAKVKAAQADADGRNVKKPATKAKAKKK